MPEPLHKPSPEPSRSPPSTPESPSVCDTNPTALATLSETLSLPDADGAADLRHHPDSLHLQNYYKQNLSHRPGNRSAIAPMEISHVLGIGLELRLVGSILLLVFLCLRGGQWHRLTRD